MTEGGITREELREDLSALHENVRVEVDAKLDSLKWRMVAALLGGQVLAGLVAAAVTKDVTTPARVGLYLINFVAS